MKRHHNLTPSTSTSTSTSKKMWEEPEPEPETDELMALLGYNVKSSDMSQVAQNIQLLEHAMTTVQQDNLCQLASQTLHHNPSDMSSYLESILSEFNPPQETTFRQPQKSSIFDSFDNFDNSVVIFDDSDLTAIPGNAIIPPPCKRMKTNELTKSTLTRPVVLVDSQENGVKLVHALMACAEAIEKGDLKLAEALVKEIGFLAVSQQGTMKKVATYFAEGLARRIYKVYPCGEDNHGLNDFLEMHFYETCPYLKFAHFTANQGILEAFVGKEDVHVVDFGIKDGMQWPPLLQALATRAGGPPRFRLTGIGPGLDSLKEVGWKLGQMAESMDIKFEYGFSVVGSIADLDISMFDVREGETIAVNSIFELHQVLANDGGIERVFDVVKELKPAVFTVVEQEANHNGDVFFDRFTEALHYYSTMFDSLEGCGGDEGGCGGVSDQDKVMSEVYLGRQICNVVSCEGVERVERHENLMQWRTRFGSMGFDPVHLSSNAFKQASMLLALFNGEGYKVEENNGCLLLGWHTRPLIATSAWKLS